MIEMYLKTSIVDQGCTKLHLDILDGHFVPSNPINIVTFRAIVRKCTELGIDIDAHLMVSKDNVNDWVNRCTSNTITNINFHVEGMSSFEVNRVIRAARFYNKQVGIAISPQMTVKDIKQYIPLVDIVLVLSAELGRGGTKFNYRNLEKVRELSKIVSVRVDGGVDYSNIRQIVKSGASSVVVGSAYINQINKKQMVDLFTTMLSSTRARESQFAWEIKEAKHTPFYESNDFQHVIDEISSKPPITNQQRIDGLSRSLEHDDTFIIMIGDCAEEFGSDIKPYAKLASDLATEYIKTHNMYPVRVLRFAGQYAKPRTNRYELDENGCQNNVFWGESVNCQTNRKIDANRLLTAYNDSRDKVIQLNTDEYIAHEALLLDYEQALVRDGYATSADLLWVGNKTRFLDSAHVYFIASIKNTVGIKIDHKANLVELVEILKSHKKVVVLVVRAGLEHIDVFLPRLINTIKENELRVKLVCDPMHGNTSVIDGQKIRRPSVIQDELYKFRDICNVNSTTFGGVMLEATPHEVQECVDHGLPQSRPLCDPRLNYAQTRKIFASI